MTRGHSFLTTGSRFVSLCHIDIDIYSHAVKGGDVWVTAGYTERGPSGPTPALYGHLRKG